MVSANPERLHVGFWNRTAGAILVFWKYRSAMPGNMFESAEIVDGVTGGKPSNRQLVLRYVGYYISTLTYLLCVPVLLIVLAAVVVVFALAVDPGSLSTEIPHFR